MKENILKQRNEKIKSLNEENDQLTEKIARYQDRIDIINRGAFVTLCFGILFMLGLTF